MSSLDDLEAEGGDLAEAAATDAAAAAAPTEFSGDPAICRRGPCRYFAEAHFPTGLEVRPGVALVNQKFSCRAGVEFTERLPDPRTKLMIGVAATLPIDCTAWAPLTKDELDELDQRRMAEQDRHADKLEAEAARAAAAVTETTEGP